MGGGEGWKHPGGHLMDGAMKNDEAVALARGVRVTVGVGFGDCQDHGAPWEGRIQRWAVVGCSRHIK